MARKEKIKSKRQIFKDTVNDKSFIPYNIIDGIVVWNSPYRFNDDESSFRPKCINNGCIRPVALQLGTVDKSKGRILRTTCTQCHLYSYGKKPLDLGLTAHKKAYCENIDNHLGFPCTSTIHYSGVLELDHIDGTHTNNIPSNVETLCKICHSYKSYLNGDCR